MAAYYAHWLQTALLAGCLLWCIGTDLLARKIPNQAILILLAGWLLFRLLDVLQAGGPDMPQLWQALWALPGAALVLVVGFLLFLTGRLGAGDVKLISVLCLWVGYGHQIVFVMITALAGGVLALGLPLLNTVPTAVAMGIQTTNRIFKSRLPIPPALPADLLQGIPYGVAIAFGAMYVLIFPLF
ncbi:MULTISPECIES: A24 family peptidase [Brenneria]|uniref:Peptidase A24 n=1 Tax=Brenneria nigrifluens DSM 30175 = ATCC 13028 TaxID=1121120 RepID=A0A2U1URR9_9GAMM|nr:MULTISPECIES: prepilin peptidase [Brenneria]EHD23075.1 peptidase A24A prepilin type IV [Brenneria sp. EniD312]PWC24363.1 peptidase A24 [Brenneria nigrifluens] [Brenneria nigrifluens DSM 30175 = ATCC 13028]QCR05961.1 peptidase A24 [Brenneria nigrifluens] [Brenneria nigrifluens DSM 30175 = ATCC 13028]